MGLLDPPGFTRLQADGRFGRSPVPANAGSARTGVFDRARSLYLPTASVQAKARAALGRAATGSLVNMCCIGDSKTAGYIAGQINSWPSQLRAALAAWGVPSAGTGLVPVANSGATDSRWTGTTGTWSDNFFYSTSSTSGASKTFTSDVAGTVVDIYYFGTSAAFTYSIDGGAATTVTPAGGGTVGKTSVTGLANTTHTVTVTASSASAVYLIGICVRQTSGLLIHNFGLVGSMASAWTSTAFTQPSMIALSNSLAADIVSIEIGSNDAGNSVALSTYVSNLTTAWGLYSGAARIAIVQSPRGTLTTWPSFASAVYDQAEAAGAPLIDLSDRWGSAANGNALGLLGSDSLHETAAGHADVARAVRSALAA